MWWEGEGPQHQFSGSCSASVMRVVNTSIGPMGGRQHQCGGTSVLQRNQHCYSSQVLKHHIFFGGRGGVWWYPTVLVREAVFIRNSTLPIKIEKLVMKEIH
jgi:hypothetical protein